jgi:hypothetical protein
MRIVRQFALAAISAATMTAPSNALAQGTSAAASTDARWEAFVGCWAPEPGIPGPTAVCVLPAGAARVDVVTIAGGKVASRESIDASGVRAPSIREKCEGGDVARWSADGRRLFLVSDHICDGATRVRATGMMALPSGDEWLDVRGVSVAGGPTDVRVRRYHAIAPMAPVIPEPLLQEVLAATAERPTLRAAARTNAAAEVDIEQVIEASRTVDAAVLEAWLVENGDGFEMDRAKLVRLADAHVPSRVVDVMVALSYPNRFAIGRRWQRGEVPQPKVDTTIARPTDVATTPIYGGQYGTYGLLNRNRYCDDGLLTAVSRCYGYGDPYGYGYGNGYSPYGWGNSGWGYGYGNAPGAPPVIVVNGKEKGRVVNGQGYTRGGSTGDDEGTRTARPRSTSGTSSGASSSGNSGDRSTTRSNTGSSSTRNNDGGTKSSSGNSGSSSSGRTAKPKNP